MDHSQPLQIASAENLAALSALARSRGPISTVEAEETETMQSRACETFGTFVGI
jgi:hypothetical protein